MPPAGRTALYFDLLDGFRQPGCSICRFTLRAVDRYFETLAYESTNDIATRDGIRAARGFCNRHTARYAACRDELGAALICRDLLHTLTPTVAGLAPAGLRGLAAPLTDPSGRRRLERALRELGPRRVCPACARLAETEEFYLATLLQHLRGRDFAAAYAQSDGLCALHFGLALARCRDGARRETLAGTQRRVWTALLARAGEADTAALLTAVAGGEGIRP